MKITPENLQAVLDYVDQTQPTEQAFAKVCVLDYFMKYLSELSPEESENFPQELIADLRFADFRATVWHLINEGSIETLKNFLSDDLDPSLYRLSAPYYRANYAFLYALGCGAVVDNTVKELEGDRDLWIYRGIKAIDLAIDISSRMDNMEATAAAISLKAEILKNKSFKEAADTAILGIRIAPNDEQKKEFVELWKEITDERFDIYFEHREASFINQLPLSQETIEEMCQKDQSIGEFVDRCLCSIEADYDRSPMLFVEKIEDVSNPELEELVEAARYVFCLDRIPSELHFDEGHPKANILYVVDDEDTTLYHQYIKEEEK